MNDLFIISPLVDGDRIALVVQWDETEVDRRIEVLKNAGADPGAVAEIEDFHRNRRSAEILALAQQ